MAKATLPFRIVGFNIYDSVLYEKELHEILKIAYSGDLIGKYVHGTHIVRTRLYLFIIMFKQTRLLIRLLVQS